VNQEENDILSAPFTEERLKQPLIVVMQREVQARWPLLPLFSEVLGGG
jgi:hypothetical protein